MRSLPPLVLHAAHSIDEATLTAHGEGLVDRLQHWPDWPEIASLDAASPCDVPADARPAGGA